jgi:pimeloyl-ACP methyl ester carboxylesterase
MRPVAFALFAALLAACREGPPGRSAGAPAAAPGASFAAIDATVPSADGVPIHYRVEGGGAPPLVFVHCWSCDATYWDAQVKELAPRFRVVTVDLAGHGRSGLGRSAWTIEAFGRDLQAVVEALDLRGVVLVGHSMGGTVIVEAARLMPDRIAALIPIDSLHDVGRRPTPQQIAEFIAPLKRDFRGETTKFVRSLFPKGADPALVERVAGDMASGPPEVALGAMESLLTYDVAKALGEVRAPIRAINADRFPTNLAGNRRYAPRFDALIMTGVGHFPMLETPGAFNRLLEQAVRDLVPGAPAGAGAARGDEGVA